MVAEGAQDKAKSEAFIKNHGIVWPNGYGAGTTIKALGVLGYPTLFVIGADGKVAWNDEMGGKLKDAIDRALSAELTR